METLGRTRDHRGAELKLALDAFITELPGGTMAGNGRHDPMKNWPLVGGHLQNDSADMPWSFQEDDDANSKIDS